MTAWPSGYISVETSPMTTAAQAVVRDSIFSTYSLDRLRHITVIGARGCSSERLLDGLEIRDHQEINLFSIDRTSLLTCST